MEDHWQAPPFAVPAHLQNLPRPSTFEHKLEALEQAWNHSRMDSDSYSDGESVESSDDKRTGDESCLEGMDDLIFDVVSGGGDMHERSPSPTPRASGQSCEPYQSSTVTGALHCISHCPLPLDRSLVRAAALIMVLQLSQSWIAPEAACRSAQLGWLWLLLTELGSRRTH